MALSPTITSMCNQLTQKYGGIIQPTRSAKSAIKSRIRRMIAELESANFSSFADLQNEIYALRSRVNGVIPGSSSSDISEILQFLKNCSLFGDDFNAVSANRGSTIGIFDKIDEFILDSGISYDEFGVASIYDSIDKLLNGTNYPGGNNISGSLGNADLLIECLSSLCPDTGYTSDLILYQDEVSSLYEQLHIVSDPISPNYGKLDFDYVYNEAGMNSTQIDNMSYVIDEVTTIKEDANVSIEESIAAAKLYGVGGFV